MGYFGERPAVCRNAAYYTSASLLTTGGGEGEKSASELLKEDADDVSLLRCPVRARSLLRARSD
jgi:hypothetical protein